MIWHKVDYCIVHEMIFDMEPQVQPAVTQQVAEVLRSRQGWADDGIFVLQ